MRRVIIASAVCASALMLGTIIVKPTSARHRLASAAYAARPSFSPPPGPPEKPQVMLVDFLKNLAVRVDHPTQTLINDHGLLITEWKKNTSEWQYEGGKVVTSWPVLYAEKNGGAATLIELEAHFEVGANTKTFLETKIEGETKIIGELKLGTHTITFEKKFATPTLVAEQLKTLGFLSTKSVRANVGLPQEVTLYEQAPIKWKLEGTEVGGLAFTEAMGESKHNIFVTFKETYATPQFSFFSTLVYLATRGIEKRNKTPTEAEAVEGVWNEYAADKVPSIEYNVETGAIKVSTESLEYYKNVAIGLDVEKEIKADATCTRTTVWELLKFKDGQCGAWAQALGETFSYEAIHSELIKIEPRFGAAGECSAFDTCALLVRQWLFPCPPTSGNTKFPYFASTVTDLAGIEGQGTTNPNSVFNRHYLIKKGETLYDPSYGSAPIARPTLLAALETYQEANVAGFCNTDKEPYECRQVEPKDGLFSELVQHF